jgi:hypothetical protein
MTTLFLLTSIALAHGRGVHPHGEAAPLLILAFVAATIVITLTNTNEVTR